MVGFKLGSWWGAPRLSLVPGTSWYCCLLKAPLYLWELVGELVMF